jgi:hypothetical protein
MGGVVPSLSWPVPDVTGFYVEVALRGIICRQKGNSAYPSRADVQKTPISCIAVRPRHNVAWLVDQRCKYGRGMERTS